MATITEKQIKWKEVSPGIMTATYNGWDCTRKYYKRCCKMPIRKFILHGNKVSQEGRYWKWWAKKKKRGWWSDRYDSNSTDDLYKMEGDKPNDYYKRSNVVQKLFLIPKWNNQQTIRTNKILNDWNQQRRSRQGCT